MKIRKPEDLDYLAGLCWAQATIRASNQPPRIVEQSRHIVLADGTEYHPGDRVKLAPQNGLCESINWLAAEVLEAVEGTRWVAHRGRFGYVDMRPGANGKGVVTDNHVVLAMGDIDDDFGPRTVYADFSMHSAFWEDCKWMPMGVRGLLGMAPVRGVQLMCERLDYARADAEVRAIEERVGSWLPTVVPSVVEAMKERLQSDASRNDS